LAKAPLGIPGAIGWKGLPAGTWQFAQFTLEPPECPGSRGFSVCFESTPELVWQTEQLLGELFTPIVLSLLPVAWQLVQCEGVRPAAVAGPFQRAVWLVGSVIA